MCRPSTLAALSLLATGCFSSTLPEYERAKTAALAPAPPLADDWKPDAAILLSRQALDHLTASMLAQHGGFDTPLSLDGVGRVVPALTVTHAKFSPSKACAGCMAVDLSVDGRVQTEGLIKLDAPVALSIGLDVEVESRLVGEDHVVSLKPRDVRTVEIGRTGLPSALAGALKGPLHEQARRSLLKGERTVIIARISSSELPLRGIRVESEGQAVKIALRTHALATADLELGTVTPRSGWLFAITQESLGALARAEAMRQGPMSYDVAPEPTAFRVEGTRFELDLRLWKTTGSGWWRDYTVSGSLGVADGEVVVTPGDVDQKAASDGAAAADPLAYLGSSVIISTLRESLQVTAPALHRADVGDRAMDVSISSVRGKDGVVYVQGLLKPSAPEDRGGARGGRR